MKITKVVLTFLFSLFSLSLLWAQTGQRVNVSANTLKKGVYNGLDVQRLLGNVIITQGTTTIYSDSAYRYEGDLNKMEVFSNVRIVQGTMTINSATGSYDGNTRKAKLKGGVDLVDQDMHLVTPSLDYDFVTKIAYYTEAGDITGTDYNIKSQFGYYHTESRVLSFKRNVRLFSQNSEAVGDTLQYNTITKVMEIFGPTTVKSPDGTLYAERGTYNTITRESSFRGNPSLRTPDYLIKGELLYYDKLREFFSVTNRVRMTSLKDNTLITGDHARYWKPTGKAIVYGSPVMRSIVSKDTLYLSADTLYSQENLKDKTKRGKLYGYYNVRLYKSDLQGLADSLTYDLNDSLIYLNRNPILWANKSQMVADRMEIQMKNQTIDQLRLFANSFVISQDTLLNFNQVKGRDLVARFADGKIRRIDVFGNGESIYFPLEGDTVVTGMNRVFCSDMRMNFQNGQVETITFITDPDAKLVPPHELEEPEKRLKGFKWRSEEQPSRAAVLAKRKLVKPRVTPKTTPAKPPAGKGAKKDKKAVVSKKP